MSTRPKPPKKKASKRPPTIAALADALEISTRRVSQLRTAGMPVHSIAAAKAWRNDQADDSSTEELRRRRIALLRQQERRTKIEADERQGLLIPKALVEERESRIGFAMAAAMRAMETEIPQLCLGLPLERSRPLVKSKLREIQTGLSDGTNARFWPETLPAK